MKDTERQIQSVCWLLNVAVESAELEDNTTVQCCKFFFFLLNNPYNKQILGTNSFSIGTCIKSSVKY